MCFYFLIYRCLLNAFRKLLLRKVKNFNTFQDGVNFFINLNLDMYIVQMFYLNTLSLLFNWYLLIFRDRIKPKKAFASSQSESYIRQKFVPKTKKECNQFWKSCLQNCSVGENIKIFMAPGKRIELIQPLRIEGL